jgi:hypothetical protein
MKAPSETDTLVKVTAYLTDEEFGYEHWRAAQFSAPDDVRIRRRAAILVICDDADQRDLILKHLESEGR